MTLTATNLTTGAEVTFSHQMPEMAFSFLKAQERNEMTRWSCFDAVEKKAYLGKMRRGKFSWGWGDWAIPYPKLTPTQFGSAFIGNGGVACPRCQSTEVAFGRPENAKCALLRRDSCNCCEASWITIFKIDDVDEIKDPSIGMKQDKGALVERIMRIYDVSAYSGRAMYGKTCLAVKGEFSPFEVAIKLQQADPTLLQELGAPCTDSLGMGVVYYWPHIEYNETEEEVEEIE